MRQPNTSIALLKWMPNGEFAGFDVITVRIHVWYEWITFSAPHIYKLYKYDQAMTHYYLCCCCVFHLHFFISFSFVFVEFELSAQTFRTGIGSIVSVSYVG